MTQDLTTTSILALFETNKEQRQSFALDLISKMIVPPHKLPEPLYLAHRFASKGKPSKSVMNSIPEISTLN